MGVKDEVGFFQAVKARLVKFEPAGEGTSDVELETTIRQVIDAALEAARATSLLRRFEFSSLHHQAETASPVRLPWGRDHRSRP